MALAAAAGTWQLVLHAVLAAPECALHKPSQQSALVVWSTIVAACAMLVPG